MAAIVAVLLALIVGGLATPRHHAVARAISVPIAVADLWNTIRDVARYGEWRDELDTAEIVDGDQPQVRWRETTSGGSVTFGIVADEAPRRMMARILDEDLPYTGEWTWTLEPEADGTQLVITERGSVGNPVFRFISAHFMGHTRAIDRYLRGLATRHGVADIEIRDAVVRA